MTAQMGWLVEVGPGSDTSDSEGWKIWGVGFLNLPPARLKPDPTYRPDQLESTAGSPFVELSAAQTSPPAGLTSEPAYNAGIPGL